MVEAFLKSINRSDFVFRDHLKVMSHYDSYFAGRQVGFGIEDIGPVYRSRIHYQRGRGLSDVFSGLIRFVTPYLISGTKAVGKEALRSGSELLANLGSQPIGQMLKQQRDISMQNLSQKAEDKIKQIRSSLMSGKGIKRRRSNVTDLIASLSKKRRTTKKGKKKKTVKKSKTKTKRRKHTKKAFLKAFLGK